MKSPADVGRTRSGLVWMMMAAGFALPLIFCRLGLDPHHDGIVFKPALDVAQGRVLFRETFTQYGALTTFLQTLAIKLLGEKLISIRLLTAVFYGASLMVFDRVWSRILPKKLALLVFLAGIVLAPYFSTFFLPWSSVYALFFQGLALLFALRSIERGGGLNLFLSGVATAAAHWCRQPVGLFLLVALSVGLALVGGHAPGQGTGRQGWRAIRKVGLFVLGFASLSAAFIAWLGFQGALSDWWKQSFVFAYEFGVKRGHGSILPVLRALLPRDSERAWSLVALLAATQCLWSLNRLRSPAGAADSSHEAKLVLAGVVAVSSWPQFYPVPCVNHCAWGGMPMLGVAVYLLWALVRNPKRLVRVAAWTMSATLGVLLYGDVFVRVSFAADKLREATTPVQAIRSLHGLRLPQDQAAAYETLGAIIDEYHRSRPDGTIITTTRDALYPTLQSAQATYHPVFVHWNALDSLYPEARAAGEDYAIRARPLIIGPSNLVGFDRVAMVSNLDLDVLAPHHTVARALFTCQTGQPQATDDASELEAEIWLTQDVMVGSAIIEVVRAARIADRRWDTKPHSNHPGLLLLADGAPMAGPKAHSLSLKMQAGQSFRLRTVGAAAVLREGVDDILVSLCLENGRCQRQSAASRLK